MQPNLRPAFSEFSTKVFDTEAKSDLRQNIMTVLYCAGRIEAAKSMLSPLIHSSDGDSSEGSEDPVESSPLVALDLEPADVIWLVTQLYCW